MLLGIKQRAEQRSRAERAEPCLTRGTSSRRRRRRQFGEEIGIDWAERPRRR